MDKLKPLATSELGHQGGLQCQQQQDNQQQQQPMRLINSEFNTSRTKRQHRENGIPYVNSIQNVINLESKLDELSQLYEEISLALIQLQIEMDQIKKQKIESIKSKSCPICLEEMIERDKKIACFDCGHWICEECIKSADNTSSILRCLSGDEKQSLLTHLLIHHYKQSHLLQLEENILVLRLEEDKYVLNFDSRVNLYRNTRNAVSYTTKPISFINSESEENQNQDQKPALQSLFSREVPIYCLDCPICKTKSCHFKRENCYKLVYF